LAWWKKKTFTDSIQRYELCIINYELNKAMSEFQPALQKVLAHEGGYVNDPDDPGGETYKGIARNMHSKWGGWVYIDLCKHASNLPSKFRKGGGAERPDQSFLAGQFLGCNQRRQYTEPVGSYFLLWFVTRQCR
jgi:hypothetical protein